MKIKVLALLLVISVAFIGCQTTQSKLAEKIELENGQILNVTFVGNMDESTHHMFLAYIKLDAENHYYKSKEPYKFNYEYHNQE